MKIIEEKYKWKRENFAPNTPDMIVLHHALHPNCTAQDVHRWCLDRGWKGFAYHYFVRKDGTIYRGRLETQKGGHLLESENNNTIGICLEGCYQDYSVSGRVLTEKTVPDAQMNALIELCKDIMSRWEIKAVRRHSEYPSAQRIKKLCPGTYFPWDRFLDCLYNTDSGYKAVIQENCGFSDVEKVWDVVNKHPHADELYRKWAESYIRRSV